MKFGLIGRQLGHSFSKSYFESKFGELGLVDFSYELHPMPQIEDAFYLLRGDYFGLNVTIPYKSSIIHFLNDIDPLALDIGAVNTLVRIGQYSWKGYNTDTIGFKESLLNWYAAEALPTRALVLGSGGSARAVIYALDELGISSSIVSRGGLADYTYQEVGQDVVGKHPLIINTTPIGMEPEVDKAPPISYEFMTPAHRVYDLIYNPSNTLFLQRSQLKGAKTKNGLEMLHLQAEHAWTIWKKYGKF